MQKIIFLPSIFLLLSFNLLAQDENLDAIQVIDQGDKQSLVDFVPSVAQLEGKELQKRRQTGLGEMLQWEAGVNSTYFGPSSSRPVIRGLDGDRVRILQNSLGTLDASTQSLDHAVPVDTLLIDQIEVVRGPMSLLYGSSAVGGVVNIVTNRIHSTYEEGFFSKALVQGETANNGVSSALHLNYGARRWMLHADGSTRNLGNVEVPDHVKAGASEEKGELPNSFNKQDSVAVGASHILDRGHFGLSFNHFNTRYGSVADEEVSIDMTQNRFELHGDYRPEGGVFRKLKLRSAQSAYGHREIEGGESGTRFENKGNESRLEALNQTGTLQGVLGVQTQIFSFKAQGDEAFLPTTLNEKLAIFTYQELPLTQRHSLIFGGRVENVEVEKEGSANFGASDERNFLSLNGSLGHQLKFDQKSSLSTSYSYTERAPNFQELYALGDHLASGSYEEGDSTLEKEKAHAFELSYKFRSGKHRLVVSAYTQFFNDYVSLSPTGLTGNSPDNLTEYRYEQVDAVFYGADLESRRELLQWRKGVITLLNTADFVRGRDRDSGHDLPRISPPRLSAGLEYARDRWSGDLELQYVAHQTHTATNEKWTDSYYMTNLGARYDFVSESSSVGFFARVRNVFDVEARNHVSFVKEIAPMPGRNFILGAELQL